MTPQYLPPLMNLPSSPGESWTGQRVAGQGGWGEGPPSAIPGSLKRQRETKQYSGMGWGGEAQVPQTPMLLKNPGSIRSQLGAEIQEKDPVGAGRFPFWRRREQGGGPQVPDSSPVPPAVTSSSSTVGGATVAISSSSVQGIQMFLQAKEGGAHVLQDGSCPLGSSTWQKQVGGEGVQCSREPELSSPVPSPQPVGRVPPVTVSSSPSGFSAGAARLRVRPVTGTLAT